ncbi:Uncharacterized protein HZ326_8591 [Fusarium oxysporum f. sp. albedinis]|nr:Uncharacterized protein HZ326_8591 [Fusarium oxysporum f. sp. albedinis]
MTPTVSPANTQTHGSSNMDDETNPNVTLLHASPHNRRRTRCPKLGIDWSLHRHPCQLCCYPLFQPPQSALAGRHGKAWAYVGSLHKESPRVKFQHVSSNIAQS